LQSLKRIFFILIVLLSQSLNAQFYKGLQINVLPGFLIAHREYMANMEAHTFGIEAIYSSNFTGWANADENYRNLRWGTGLSYFNLGNNQLNGHVFAAHFHVEANLKKRTHFQSTLRFGSGFGYLTKPFNLYTNKSNKAIGSNLNGNMQVMYKAYFELNKYSELALGFGVTHYSNGNFRRPNLGINMLHLSLGWVRRVKLFETPSAKTLPELFPKKGFEFNLGYARKQIAVADTRFFNIASTSLLYYFPQSKVRNWRMGTEVFFDKTYPYSLFNEASLKHVPLSKMTEVALKVGHEFIFGRIAIITDLGTYVYRPNDYKKRVYFSIGFNYFFNKGFNAQTRLKSHMAVADYFYWSGGYRFNSKSFKKK
jgi:hypothetical protein